MTCVVGFLSRERHICYLGADSLGSSPEIKQVFTNHKVFHSPQLSDVVYGVTGGYRHQDILRYEEVLPINKRGVSVKTANDLDGKFLVTEFIPHYAQILKEKLYTENNRAGNFLMGTPNGLFEIQTDYSMIQTAENFNVVGEGRPYAMGSLYATTTLFPELEPQQHILMALRAASRYSPGVGGPFVIVNTHNNKTEVFPDI